MLSLVGLSEEKKESLKVRLENESREMKNKFGVLVTKTRTSLLSKAGIVQGLKCLIANSDYYEKVYNKIKKVKKFDKLILLLSDHWSFFDFGLLELVIQSFCIDDRMGDLDTYKEAFEVYCKRRLSEVPDKFLKEGSYSDSFCLKLDENFTYRNTTLLDIKRLQYKLSKLLKMELVLLHFKEGCLELTLISLTCALPLPVWDSQLTKDIKELGIIRVYSDSLEYFKASNSAYSDRYVYCMTGRAIFSLRITAV